MDRSNLRIAIVGAGLSGVAAVYYLRKAGYTDVTVFEKAPALGGTWRDNAYPGLQCDIPSYWYQFKFAPNPDWSRRFSAGPEIRAYLERVADNFGIRSAIRFNAEITQMVYRSGRWKVTTAANEHFQFDVVISATGILHHINIPDIPGLDSFEGDCFHSARWQPDAQIDGARVGVIGTGSTSAQITGALGGRARQLTVFQRTPQWMFPALQRNYGNVSRFLMRNVPGMHRLMYRSYQIAFEWLLSAVIYQKRWISPLVRKLCEYNLKSQVKDPELRAKLTPDYAVGCKRLVICSSFYEAIERDDVALVTDSIVRIEPAGVRTRDGRLHELDTLVVCTGFQANRFTLPIRVVGEQGRVLADRWGESPRAHRSMSVPGFPNFWMLEGPTGPVGNISLVEVSEIQIEYIIQCLDAQLSRGAVAIDTQESAFERFNRQMSEGMRKTVWSFGGCDSWYIDASGEPNIYPFTPAQFRRSMRKPVFAEYRFVDPVTEVERGELSYVSA